MVLISINALFAAAMAASVAVAIPPRAPLAEVVRAFKRELSRCTPLPPRPTLPTHVSDIRPDEISVVMAMGDSVVAGVNSRYTYNSLFGNVTYRKTFPQLEHRGISFATGGDDDAISIAGIINQQRIRTDRSAVVGMSLGTTTIGLCQGPNCPAASPKFKFNSTVLGFNAAQSGSWVTKHNINNQFKYLDKQYMDVVGRPAVEPWKLMIYEHGFNNLCLGCNALSRGTLFNAKVFERNVRYMLDHLRKEYKNMIVVLIGPFPMTQHYKLIQSDPVCAAIHSGIDWGCPCLFHNSRVNNPIMDRLSVEYNRRLSSIAADYQSRGWDDFSVIYDPALGKADLTGGIASVDLSGRDCFHPSHLSHTRFAAGLWNNLMVSEHERERFNATLTPVIKCPTEHDRIILD